MNIIRTLVGPKSKYDHALPYTYEARIDLLDGMGDESTVEHFYADTLCGLVHYLDDNQIEPKDVQLVAVFEDEEILIDSEPITRDKKWLRRPHLCRALEKHYQNSQLKQYRGHEMHSVCEYTDRDKRVI